MNLFRTSHRLGRYAEADSWFKKVGQVAYRPLVWEWSEYARLQVTLSKYAEAAEAYMAASRLIPASYFHVCQAGTNYYVANRYDEALPAARRCLELAASAKGGDDAVHHAHRIVSDMLSDRGVYDLAAAHAREALATEVDDPYAHHYLARALSGQRRFTEAVTSAKNAIRLSDGKYGFMHFELGNAHFQLRQWPEAVQAFKKAAELEPMDSSAASTWPPRCRMTTIAAMPSPGSGRHSGEIPIALTRWRSCEDRGWRGSIATSGRGRRRSITVCGTVCEQGTRRQRRRLVGRPLEDPLEEAGRRRLRIPPQSQHRELDGHPPEVERLVTAPHVDVDQAALHGRTGIHHRVDAAVFRVRGATSMTEPTGSRAGSAAAMPVCTATPEAVVRPLQ